MAALSEAKRAEAWAEWIAQNDEVTGCTKANIRAAVDALDDYMDTNAVLINAAIPQPARGALTTAQKARILMLVTAKRFLEGA